MAIYFDSDEAVDKALLHSSVRTHSDLDRIINEVEDDIIEVFRVEGTSRAPTSSDGNQGVYQVLENGVYHTTFLWGYKPVLVDAAGYDATRANWTGFAKVMRQAIADVVSHRVRHYDADDGVTAESHGRESWDYQKGRNLRWPAQWDRLLDRYVPDGYDPRHEILWCV